MAEKILAEIKKAEKDAEDMIAEAEKKAQEIKKSAKENANRILTAKEREAAAARVKILSTSNEKTQAARQKIIDSGKTELSELVKTAQKRKQKAVELILKSFEEMLK